MKTLVAALITSALLLAATGCKDTSTVSGEGGRKITLIKPGDLSIKQGQTATVTVRITRTAVDGPVTVSFSKLPGGVTVVDTEKKMTGDEGVYTLQAGDSADVVSGQQAEVKVEGPQGLAATEMFRVEVTAK